MRNLILEATRLKKENDGFGNEGNDNDQQMLRAIPLATKAKFVLSLDNNVLWVDCDTNFVDDCYDAPLLGHHKTNPTDNCTSHQVSLNKSTQILLRQLYFTINAKGKTINAKGKKK